MARNFRLYLYNLSGSGVLVPVRLEVVSARRLHPVSVTALASHLRPIPGIPTVLVRQPLRVAQRSARACTRDRLTFASQSLAQLLLAR